MTNRRGRVYIRRYIHVVHAFGEGEIFASKVEVEEESKTLKNLH